jgi:hypothetical protein
MKRINCCLRVLATCLFYVSIAQAQDPGFVPVFDGSLNLIDSPMFQTEQHKMKKAAEWRPNFLIKRGPRDVRRRAAV